MTEVAANYNINLTQVIDNNTELDASQAAEVEAVLKAAGDDKIWDVFQVGGAGKPINKPGATIPTVLDPTYHPVIEITKFAVRKYNELAGTHLVFVRVIACLEWIVVLGTFYALKISTKDDKGEYVDTALVFKSKTGYKKLIRYTHN